MKGTIRWWPALVVFGLTAGALVWIQQLDELPFQQRNLRSLAIGAIGCGLLLIWWIGFSRARGKTKLLVLAALVGIAGVTAGAFKIEGVSGDLVPILTPRWSKRPAVSPAKVASTTPVLTANESNAPTARLDYPQFLGPNRDGVLDDPKLNPDWQTSPPRVSWRQPIGPAWSGFVVVGHRAITQEQHGEEELVTCYDLATGRLLWSHADAARYQTTIAGEGPRCTPAVVSNRVFTLGATGWLNCLDLATGRELWQSDIRDLSGREVPSWGFSGSPLVANGRVHISAGGKPDRSLLAFDMVTGELAWAAGGSSISYGSPSLATLAGVPQILCFNARRISSHDLGSGRVLWEYPWGVGQPHVSNPVPVGTNRVLFSSGYGVGSELLEITRGSSNEVRVGRVWKSNRMKSKFGSLAERGGMLYGLDDGMLACLDLKDGSLRWKEGRYGHGQGLWVNSHLVLMAESGELVLLQPDAQGPHELHRFRVFDAKTWNPIAISGDWLLARNDREAACLRLPIQ